MIIQIQVESVTRPNPKIIAERNSLYECVLQTIREHVFWDWGQTNVKLVALLSDCAFVSYWQVFLGPIKYKCFSGVTMNSVEPFFIRAWLIKIVFFFFMETLIQSKIIEG